MKPRARYAVIHPLGFSIPWSFLPWPRTAPTFERSCACYGAKPTARRKPCSETWVWNSEYSREVIGATSQPNLAAMSLQWETIAAYTRELWRGRHNRTLAERLGVPRTTAKSWLTGKRRMPIAQMHAMADALRHEIAIANSLALAILRTVNIILYNNPFF